MSIKDRLHKIIDSIQDDSILKGYLTLLQRLDDQKVGGLLNKLTKDEKAELLLAYEESLDQKNLLSHDDFKKNLGKWLKK